MSYGERRGRAMYNSRLEKLRDAIKAEELDAMVVANPMSIFYLTGAKVYPLERMWLLLVRADGKDVLFANKLFVFDEPEVEVLWHSDNDDAPAVLCSELSGVKRLGTERDLTAKYIIPIIETYPQIAISLTAAVDDIRIIKDSEECDRMRKSSVTNDKALEYAFSKVREGMTEKELAAFVKEGFEKQGVPELSFETIVAFGENASDPHHGTGDTKLKKGDCVLIDMGGIYEGYCSDMTRTKFFGAVTEEQRKVYETMRMANETAKTVIRPGVRFCDIDAVARNLISDAGYGEYFTHRLGHGIGMTVHEPQDVSPVNTNTVKPGMCFSIEPGIYLPGKFGVRIEDLVIVTEDGCECLNNDSRDLQII